MLNIARKEYFKATNLLLDIREGRNPETEWSKDMFAIKVILTDNSNNFTSVDRESARQLLSKIKGGHRVDLDQLDKEPVKTINRYHALKWAHEYMFNVQLTEDPVITAKVKEMFLIKTQDQLTELLFIKRTTGEQIH